MYTRKEINAVIKTLEPNTPLYGMMQDYFRLKTSWIPQVLDKLEMPDHGLAFPHKVKAKPCQHVDVDVETKSKDEFLKKAFDSFKEMYKKGLE